MPWHSCTVLTLGYRERLWLGPVGWLSALGFAASLGVAYAAATTARWGWVVAAGCAVVTAAFARHRAPLVAVSATDFTAGEAHIELRHLDGVRALTATQVTLLRRHADGGRGWWCAPGWVRTGVLVTISDATDPHEFWVVATRRPEQLTQALTDAGVPPLAHGSSSDR